MSAVAPPPAFLAETCPMCDGSGVAGGGQSLECVRCTGTGRVIRGVYPKITTAAAHMVLDKQDQELARRDDQIRVLKDELRRQKDVIRAFLQELDDWGIDLTEVPEDLPPGTVCMDSFGNPRLPSTISIDAEKLIQLRDLVRKP